MIEDAVVENPCSECGASHPPSFAFRGTERAWHRPVPTRSAPPDDRFWHFVDRRGPDECWEWTGQRRGARGALAGYGAIGVGGERVGAHRYSYELHHGPIAGGLWVLHKCDNPPCCNPAHLFLGTPRDNAKDMGAKGRNFVRRGTANHNSKLTPEQVLAIWSSSRKSHELAAEHGVARRIVNEIRLGRMWTTVTGGPSPAARSKATIPWKLTDEKLVEIRRLADERPPLSLAEIGRRVGVAGNTVRTHLRLVRSAA